MDRARPSKRIFFLLIACVIFVGTIGFAVYSAKSGLAKTGSSSVGIDDGKTITTIQDSLKKTANQDDDNDGLANWEEALWKTDSKKADTDGDGTNDGDEVKAGRNPAVAGPNDKLQDGQPTTKTAAAKAVAADTTVTGQMSRALFATYIQAKQAGTPINADVQNQIIAEAFSESAPTATAKQYSQGELRISPSSDLKQYGNSLGLAFSAGKAENTTTEIDILSEALSKSDKDGIKKLDPIIAGYSAIVNQLAAITVPKDMALFHLALLNNTSRVLGDIKDFRQIFDDPLLSLKSLGNYYTDVAGLQKSVADINAVFNAKGITFGPSEYGRVFAQTI